jgi:hypothetical protein
MKCSCGIDHDNAVDRFPELVSINIATEMELIQRKKSKLSANQRKEVEVRYIELIKMKDKNE